MRTLQSTLALLLLASTAAAQAGRDDAPSALDVGEKLGRTSSLRDLRGNRRSLADVGGAIVLVFVGTECPLANLYLPRILTLEERYRDRVRFVAVYPNENETIPEVAAHADERGIPFLVVKDLGQGLSDELGVERTPTAAVLDAEGVLRYRGRIDDQYSVASRKQEPESDDLADALDELLDLGLVSVPETEADGCLLDRDRLDPGVGDVTFARDVAPILQRRCQTCHRPGQIGPFPLISYEDAAKRRRMIGEVVVQRRMPPWHADERYGTFANDRSLSDDEVAVVQAWVENEAPRGDPADMPPPVEWSDWQIEEPDLVMSLPEPIDVPADGVLDYMYQVTETDFEADVWVQEVEIRPGDPSVVHHALVYIQPPGARGFFDRTTRALVNWVPGTMAKVNPPGTATRIPKGSKLLWELHYTPNGKATTDRTSMAIVWAKEPPERETKFSLFANFRINVQAESPHHEERHTMRFDQEARLVSLRPHMHLRGKSWRYELDFPDGRTETLLNVPNWDFNWQTEYFFEEPIVVPPGSRLRSIARWDNSDNNPANPDPTRSVRYGKQTFHEMMNGWVKYDLARAGPDR